MTSETESVFIVYNTSESYDNEENHCGNSFCLIGIFTNSQKAKDVASHYRGEIEIRTLNDERPVWY